MLKRLRPDELMDLKIDYAFKQLFGVDRNKDLTIEFLNAVLNREGNETIHDISFENTEFAGDQEEDKKSRLDILALTEKGEYINIEIQFTNEYDMVKRSLYYWSGLYRSRIRQGEPYRKLQPVIMINILNFPLPEEKAPDFHHSYAIQNRHHFHQLTNHLEMHFIEIPTLIIHWRKGKLDTTHHLLAKWLLLLGMVDRRNQQIYEDIYHELEEIAMSDKSLKGAFEQWEYLSDKIKNRIAYERRWMQIKDDLVREKEAELRLQEAEEEAEKKGHQRGHQQGHEKGHETGRAEGHAEGRAEGRAEGCAEGHASGHIEGREQGHQDVAEIMLKKGMEIEEVCLLTGLDEETVRSIKDNSSS
ncbi:Rpn family recombination-promoting nuclease/putative transposase [Salibacterium halotolerans]|uniref:Rpn family recombination-promoting nuclease/putative transposase n=1 Tax=Salibacterium halotolerans TaxID=1884432 RepID=A0A1I5X4T0_9BACI|nr:Rpn family recombination-promoting nuclease/putative transposase [Salibacterium halotolerans]SFQ26960.1 conserved hypothetical protein (putative transposase or invertase) [Salibacterium halotolerans]